MSSALVRQILIWGSIIALLVASLSVIQPFLLSLAMGFTFAIALAPTHRAIVSRFKFKRRTASAVLSVVFVFLIFAPIAFAVFKILGYASEHNQLVSQLTSVEKTFLQLVQVANEKFHLRLDRSSTRELITTSADSTKTYVIDTAKAMAASIPDAIVQFVVMVITIFLVLLNQRRVFSKGFEILGISQSCATQVSAAFYSVCRDVVFANVVTGAIQASLVTIGVVAFTSFDPFLVFVFTFVVSFIPVIGAAPVLLAVATYLILQNAYSAALCLVCLSFIVGVSDNIIRARLMTSQGNDRMFIDLLASIGGVYIWGLAGIFMGPFVVILSAKIIPLLIKEAGLKVTARPMAPVITPVAMAVSEEAVPALKPRF